MKRKYPLKRFLFGVALQFFIFNFILFLLGAIFTFIGIWSKSCSYIGTAFLILDLIVSLVQQIKIVIFTLKEDDDPKLNEIKDAICDPDDPNAFMEYMEEKIKTSPHVEAEDHNEYLKKLVVYRNLNASIHEGMTLDEMIDAFAAMCKTSVGDPDDILFETGTYSFSGEKEFTFSLVRQFKFLDHNEYVQLRLCVTYAPRLRTALLYKVKWIDPKTQDLVQMVKSSLPYKAVKNLPYRKVNIHIEET